MILIIKIKIINPFCMMISAFSFEKVKKELECGDCVKMVVIRGLEFSIGELAGARELNESIESATILEVR